MSSFRGRLRRFHAEPNGAASTCTKKPRLHSLSTDLFHMIASDRGPGSLYDAEVQLRPLLDQVAQREKELIVRLGSESLELLPTVPLPPFALFRLANLCTVEEVLGFLRVDCGSERAELTAPFPVVAGMSRASEETHLWSSVV